MHSSRETTCGADVGVAAILAPVPDLREYFYIRDLEIRKISIHFFTYLERKKFWNKLYFEIKRFRKIRFLKKKKLVAWVEKDLYDPRRVNFAGWESFGSSWADFFGFFAIFS